VLHRVIYKKQLWNKYASMQSVHRPTITQSACTAHYDNTKH